MPYVLETTDWPLIRLKVEGAIVRSEVPALIDDLAAVYTRRERFVHLVEIRRFRVEHDSTAPFAEWMKRNENLIATYNVGVALVCISPFFRFFMSTLFLLQPIPTFHTTVSSPAEAEVWLRERLQAEGMAVPAVLRPARSSRAG